MSVWAAVVMGAAVVLVTPVVLWAAFWVAMRAAEEQDWQGQGEIKN